MPHKFKKQNASLKYKSLALAVSFAVTGTAHASGTQLAVNTGNPGYSEFFKGASFSAQLNQELMRPEVISDLDAFLSEYRTSNLTAEQVGALASKIEYGMRLKGYAAGVEVQKSPDGSRPLCLIITLKGQRQTTVDAAAISAYLKQEMAKNQGKSAEDYLSSAASTFKSGIEAEDKEQWAVSQAKSWAQSTASNAVNQTAGMLGDNVKSQIQLMYDEEEGTILPTGKILIPLIDHAKSTYYTQLSFNEGYDDRYLGHLGFGARWYPSAETLKDRGEYGIGTNLFYDHDFSRGHKRYSLGGEFFYDTLQLSGNIYQRLTSWKDSEDFDAALVEERVANGWDIRAKYALPMYTPLQFTGGLTQWYGDAVAPFGAGSADDLMKDPTIYDIGLNLNLTNAISLNYSYKNAAGDGTDQQFGLNFNFPLDNSISKSFDLVQSGTVNTVDQSPYAFADRDETMPLEYREKSGRFAILYLGAIGNNRHAFALNTGLDSGKNKFQGLTITPKDQCVIFDNGGGYTTDDKGQAVASILSTLQCPQPYTSAVVTVRAGDSQKDFTLAVTQESFSFKAEQDEIYSDEMTRLKVEGAPQAVYAVKSSYQAKEKSANSVSGKAQARAGLPYTLYFDGKPLNADWFRADDSGKAELDLVPDETVDYSYEAAVVLTAAAGGQSQAVSVSVGSVHNVSFGDAQDGGLVWGDANHNGIPDVSLDLSGGKPGSEIIIGGEDFDKVTVIPEKPVFDADGNAGIIIEQKPGTDIDSSTVIEIDPGTGDHEIVITNPTFDPQISVSPEQLGYGEDFTVHITGAKPGSTIELKPAGPNGECVPEPSTVTVDKHGNADVTYSGVEHYVPGGSISIDLEVEVSATDDGRKEIHQEVQLEEPELDLSGQLPDGGLVFGDSDGDGKGDVTIDLEGGIPGQEIDIAGPDADKVSIEPNPPVFDEDGKLTVTIEENTSGNNQDIELEIGTGGSESEKVTITHDSYTPVLTAPDAVDYGGQSGIKVSVSGAKPGSAVRFLPVDGITAAAPDSVTADQTGYAESTYSGIADFAVKNFTIEVEYTADNDGTLKRLTHQITLNDAALSFDVPEGFITAVDQELVFVLKGPQAAAGQEVSFSVSGNGELDAEKSDTVFREDGTAIAAVKPIYPYHEAVSVTAEALGGRSVQSAAVEYALIKQPLHFDYSDESLNFKGQSKTIDYDTPFKLIARDLTPGTKVEVTSPEKLTAEVGTDGTAVLAFKGITDTKVKSLHVEGTYYQSADPASKTEFTSDEIKLYQYTEQNGTKLTLSAAALNEFNEIDLTLANGRPDSAVKFTVQSGSAQIVQDASSTDDSGSAVIKIKAAEPYDASVPIVIACEHLGNTLTSEPITLSFAQAIDSGSLSYEVSPTAGPLNEIEYDDPFNLKISGLLENSVVAWDSAADLKPNAATSIANEDCHGTAGSRTCSTTMSFAGIKNYALTKISAATQAIKGRFARNISELKNPQGSFTAPDLTLKQYDNTLSLDGGIDHVDAGDTFTVKLTDAKNGHTPVWSVIDGAQDVTKVSDSGPVANNEAAATFKVNDHAAEHTIIVQAEIMGKTPTVSVPIQLDPSDAIITNLTELSGLKFGTAFTVNVAPVRPDTDVTVKVINKADSSVLAAKTVHAGADEEAVSLSFDGLSGSTAYSAQEVSLNLTYMYNANEQRTDENKGDIKLYDYALSEPQAQDSSSAFTEGQQKTVTVSGGVPYAPVTFSSSNEYFKLSNADSTFDENGNAKVMVTTEIPDTLSDDASLLKTIIKAQSPMQGGKSSPNGEFTLQLTDYSQTIALSTPALEYNQGFDLQVSGARPQTAVSVTLKQPDGTEIENVSGTADADGSAALSFAGISNLTLSEITAELTYYADAQKQQTKSFNLSFAAHHLDDLIIENGNTFNEGDKRKVTVNTGVPGAEVSWSSTSELFKLENTKTTAGPDGIAVVYVTAEVPAVLATSSLSGKLEASTTLQGGSSVSADVSITLTDYSSTIALDLPDDAGTDTVDYKESFVIKVSGARPDTQVTLALKHDGHTEAAAEGKVLEDGTAELQFAEGLADYALEQVTAELTYYASAAGTADSPKTAILNLKDYNPQLSLNKTGAFTENESRTVTFAGGKDGAAVTWEGSDYFELSNEQPVFDAQGKAAATITAKVPVSVTRAALSGTVKASTALHGGKEDVLTTDDLSVTLTEYKNTVTLPSFKSKANTTDYEIAIPVKISDVRPGAELTLELYNGSTKLETKTATAEDGTVSVDFKGIEDYTVKSLTLKVSGAMQNAQTPVNIEKTISLYPYALEDIKIDNKAGNSTDFNEGLSRTITIGGGRQGVAVKWTLSDDSIYELSEDESEFNAQGIASVTVTAKVPDTMSAAEATTFGSILKAETTLYGKQSKSVNLSGTYSTYTPAVTLANPYDGIYVNDSTHVTDKANTIDFDEVYTLKVTDARPNTTIAVKSSGAVVPTKSTFTVGKDGSIELTFKAISSEDHADLNGKSIEIEYTYYDRANHKTSQTKTVKLVNYAVSLTSDKEVIIGNETFTVTASGGKPGAKVDWSIEGNGTYTAKDATFDSNGQAEATVQGVEPYSSTITVICMSSFGEASESVKGDDYLDLVIGDHNNYLLSGYIDGDVTVVNGCQHEDNLGVPVKCTADAFVYVAGFSQELYSSHTPIRITARPQLPNYPGNRYLDRITNKFYDVTGNLVAGNDDKVYAIHLGSVTDLPNGEYTIVLTWGTHKREIKLNINQ